MYIGITHVMIVLAGILLLVIIIYVIWEIMNWREDARKYEELYKEVSKLNDLNRNRAADYKEILASFKIEHKRIEPK